MTRVHSWIKVVSTWCVGFLCALAVGQAVATTGAVNSTDDPNYTVSNTNVYDPGYLSLACLNGKPNHTKPDINCNIYGDKRDVWLSGSPIVAALGDGTYFFAVLVPGGQNDPNDGSANNLSCAPLPGVCNDFYTDRTFTISGGVISSTGHHEFDSANNLIQLFPYNDTTNPGGEYILAVCQYDPTDASTYPVDPSTCKYDAFKVLVGSGQGATAAIVACKFDDANGNGNLDPTETLLPSWKITAENVITDSNTIGEQTATTDGSGCVSFTIDDPTTLQPGQTTVTLHETQKNGWIQTAPLLTTSYGCYTGSANGVATVTAPFVAGTIICTVYFGNTNLEEEDAVTASKTAVPTELYTWSITKTVTAPTVVEQASGSHTFNYTVTVSHDDGVWKLSGVITLTSTFIFDIPNLTVVDNPGIAGQTCSVSATSGFGGNPQTDLTTGNLTGLTIPAGAGTATGVDAVLLSYSCTFAPSSVNSSTTYTNTVHVLDSSSADIATPGTQTYSFANVITDDCVTVKDDSNPTATPPLPATVCVGGSGEVKDSFTFTYSRIINVLPNCNTYPNEATFKTDDTGTTGKADASVELCGPAATGALTMGFWQNKNGQGIISAANQSALGTWLRTYHPFSDAPSSGLATYVYNIIKAATCSGTTYPCNAMLRAQDLATSLDVYFSDPALGGNKIGAFNGMGNTQKPIGGVSIDLTKICKMIDGSTSTCSGTYEDATPQFGSPAGGCMTISGMILYQNTSDPAADAGKIWYGNVKAPQVVAKDAFDAVNNGVAFPCP